jgi:hypothetical protein
MADSNPSAHPPLDVDDPRISEWLDGRLAPSEAAAIERAVAASPELTLLVEDLRTIRKAMRGTPGDTPRIDLGDRIMAAIMTLNGGGAPVTPLSRGVASTPRAGRRLPWLGLLGALAAGVLVTVVINLPNDNGREVALAPGAIENGGFDGRIEGSRESSEDSSVRKGDVAKEGENRRAVADNKAAGQGRGEFFVREGLRDHEMKRQVPSEASPTDALAANALSSPDLADLQKGHADAAHDESIAMFAGGNAGPSPQPAAAPASPPAVTTVPPPTGEPRALAESNARSLETQEAAAAPAAREAAKRSKIDLAGVLVIAVTNASERRTLDRLVAESGLESTPEKDHLALTGKASDVDAFLQELTRVGLVSAVPARRAAEAGKLKADERRGARSTTLIVRVVERKGKQAAPAQAHEAETKP